MLSETVLASIQIPSGSSQLAPTPSIPIVKDAGIFSLTLRPHFTPSTIFKKSSASPHCVALSKNHVFAAQADKAVVHVYGREKGNQEMTVPFGEKVTVLATAGEDGSWVVAGMESGSVLIWETYNGRLLKAQQAHIQSVTAIAVDKSSQYFLTGSSDSTVLVWSFASLLAYPDDLDEPFSNESGRRPEHTLTAHRGSITALSTGHSESSSNFAVSLSEDRSALLWHICSGVLLRTYLLPEIPRALTTDPADRACYVGYEDGTVHMLDFYQSGDVSSGKASVLDRSADAATIQAQPSSRWQAPPGDGSKNEGLGAALCLSLSFDATKLVAGHQNGKISIWDVGNGRYEGDICILPGAVTNLEFLTPPELTQSRESSFNLTTLVKPKFDASNSDELENATFTGELLGNLPDLKFGSDFRKSLYGIGFPQDMLWEGASQLQELREQGEKGRDGGIDHTEDFISLDANEKSTVGGGSSVEDELEHLREQVKSLQNLQKQNFTAMRGLRQERELLLQELEERNDEESEEDDEDEDGEDEEESSDSDA